MDIILKNIRTVSAGRITEKDIAISGGIFREPENRRYEKEIDGKNLLAVPGFIDTHIHLPLLRRLV